MASNTELAIYNNYLKEYGNRLREIEKQINIFWTDCLTPFVLKKGKWNNEKAKEFAMDWNNEQCNYFRYIDQELKKGLNKIGPEFIHQAYNRGFLTRELTKSLDNINVFYGNNGDLRGLGIIDVNFDKMKFKINSREIEISPFNEIKELSNRVANVLNAISKQITGIDEICEGFNVRLVGINSQLSENGFDIKRFRKEIITECNRYFNEVKEKLNTKLKQSVKDNKEYSDAIRNIFMKIK